MQAAGIADRLKARNIGFAISDAALDVVVKVRHTRQSPVCDQAYQTY